ncbi:hypothetical protein AB0L41_34765 [Amycolatopsis mediterranei]|uniref:hypothetical protein n=1 Tax=Amycolatopsis mediterranei TaxID=33910 RepID=UPI0034459C91
MGPREVLAAKDGVEVVRATAAYGIITTSFWKLAEALPALRLAGITVLAIVVMSGWLMVHNRLWDSPSGHDERQKALLYNASTALTLSIGVACMYARAVTGLGGLRRPCRAG